MKQHKISFMLVLPLTLVLVLAPVLAFDFASRRGSPTTDVSVESLTPGKAERVPEHSAGPLGKLRTIRCISPYSAG